MTKYPSQQPTYEPTPFDHLIEVSTKYTHNDRTANEPKKNNKRGADAESGP